MNQDQILIKLVLTKDDTLASNEIKEIAQDMKIQINLLEQLVAKISSMWQGYNMDLILPQPQNKKDNADIVLPNILVSQKYEKIDMLILYSDPLVKIKTIKTRNNQIRKEINPTPENVDFRAEIKILKDMLESLNLDIKISIEVATMKNLQQAFLRNPKILHIICHGTYSDNNFSLNFEQMDGSLETLDQDMLKNLFSN